MGRVPKPLPLSDIMEQYPVKYEESMNTVLVQEVYIQYKQKSIITMEAVIQVYVCCQSIGILYLVGNIASHVKLLEMFWTQLPSQSYTLLLFPEHVKQVGEWYSPNPVFSLGHINRFSLVVLPLDMMPNLILFYFLSSYFSEAPVNFILPSMPFLVFYLVFLSQHYPCPCPNTVKEI